MSQQENTPLVFLVLITLCFSIYFNCLNNAFISDDIDAIVENPFISQPLRYWLQPVNLLSSIGYLIQGYNPFIQHLINIILHSINTILVFMLLRLFFKPEASLLGACIFATHPIHAEAVTWISGRNYLITTLFILTTYLLYNKATNPTHRRSKAFFYLLSLSIFSYFIIHKINISFFSFTPFLLVLSDITFNKWRKTWKFWIPFFVILAIRLILAMGYIGGRVDYMAGAIGERIIINPLIKAANILFAHLYFLLWPIKLTLYSNLVLLSPLKLILSITVLFLLILSLPFILKRSRQLFFAIGLFILFLCPVYNPIVIASPVAERYLYFPSISLCIFLAFLYEKYAEKSRKAKIITLSLFIILISLYSIRTIIRNEDWKTPERFCQATIAVSYNSPLANNEIGKVYHEKGEFYKAMDFYRKAIRLQPDYAKAYYNLGNAYNDIGKKQEAMALYKRAIEINPNLAEAYNNLAVLYYIFNQFDLAINHCDKAVELGYKVSPDLLKLIEPYRKK